jgi:hypothetical protein
MSRAPFAAADDEHATEAWVEVAERGAEARAAAGRAVCAENRGDLAAGTELFPHRHERRFRGAVLLQVVVLPEPLQEVSHEEAPHGLVVVHDDEQRLR